MPVIRTTVRRVEVIDVVIITRGDNCDRWCDALRDDTGRCLMFKCKLEYFPNNGFGYFRRCQKCIDKYGEDND